MISPPPGLRLPTGTQQTPKAPQLRPNLSALEPRTSQRYAGALGDDLDLELGPLTPRQPGSSVEEALKDIANALGARERRAEDEVNDKRGTYGGLSTEDEHLQNRAQSP